MGTAWYILLQGAGIRLSKCDGGCGRGEYLPIQRCVRGGTCSEPGCPQGQSGMGAGACGTGGRAAVPLGGRRMLFRRVRIIPFFPFPPDPRPRSTEVTFLAKCRQQVRILQTQISIFIKPSYIIGSKRIINSFFLFPNLAGEGCKQSKHTNAVPNLNTPYQVFIVTTPLCAFH